MPETHFTSIVILTKNGGELLKDSIRMIFQQQTSFSFEVIVIDSGSTDGTLEFMKTRDIRLYEILPEQFCFGPTRDLGFSHARGEYIVTLSQDVVPDNELWLQELINPLINDQAEVVRGDGYCPQDKHFFFWDRMGLFYCTNEGKLFDAKYGSLSLSCTTLAMRRKVWETTGFGSVPMSEDKALQKKVYSLNYRVSKAKSALARHGHTYTLRSLIKRCENEGMGWNYLGEKYTFVQMLRDLVYKRWIYGVWVRGIVSGEIKTFAELFFPIIRPIAVYRGNHFNINYKH